jgi:alkylation response protein AidB-like acyl-CoA dehydrogenase
VARVSAADAYRRAAASAIQVHGGLGFTWDCDVQLYFKRARSSALLLGDPRHHREGLALRLGWGGAH